MTNLNLNLSFRFFKNLTVFTDRFFTSAQIFSSNIIIRSHLSLKNKDFAFFLEVFPEGFNLENRKLKKSLVKCPVVYKQIINTKTILDRRKYKGLPTSINPSLAAVMGLIC